VRLTRVYVDEPLAGSRSCVIAGSAANHIMRVLRLREGDALTLFDGRGGEYGARLTGFRKDAVLADVLEHRAIERESALDLTLLQGVSRGERMDWVMQKATELGVRRIVPMLTERSVVRLDERQSERKHEHWRAIVIAACEQCGRNRVPEVSPPMDFFDALPELGTVSPQSPGGLDVILTRLVLSPGGSLRVRGLRGPRAIALLIGPEGGLSEAELEAAIRAGFQPVQLGPRILRTETAAIAALAALQHAFGDL
jgi:16S rRNA (uracil1498-N3)-methyltransferase